jgi:hypothetical protein
MVLPEQYSRLPPRSAYAGGGTPSGVQGAEPPGLPYPTDAAANWGTALAGTGGEKW